MMNSRKNKVRIQDPDQASDFASFKAKMPNYFKKPSMVKPKEQFLKKGEKMPKPLQPMSLNTTNIEGEDANLKFDDSKDAMLI